MLTSQCLGRVDRNRLLRSILMCSASLSVLLGIKIGHEAIARQRLGLIPDSPKVSADILAIPADNIPAPKNASVLVIHSYHPELSWTQQEKEGIDQGFADSHHAVTVYHEFLDAKRYPDLSHRQIFLDYLHTKYQDTPLDVLMIADDPGLQMLLDARQTYFPELPVVFMGINNVKEELLTIPWLTGVFETHSIAETLWVAQQQTNSAQVIVITDSSETGKANRSRLEVLEQEIATDTPFLFVEDLPDNEVQTILGPYPDDTPIFLGGQLRKNQPDGALVDFDQETEILRSHIPNPIYTDTVMRLGHGAVGGKVLDGRYHAEQAVQLVEQVLDGIPISDISPIIESKNQWVFDVNELKRLNIDLDALPPGRELINLKPSFYEQHRLMVWSALGIFSVSSAIILVLANAIRLQKRAEMQLKENEKQLEQRVHERTEALRTALDTLKSTQAKLIQTEKSSSLGRLMGGMAHEFNNPLGFITGNLDCLQEYTQNLITLVTLYQAQTSPPTEAIQYGETIDFDYLQEDIPKVLNSISRGTERIQHLVQTLNEFVRVNEAGFKPTDLNHSLDTTLLILNSQLTSDIAIIKNYGTLPQVHCKPRELNQVFMSILLNAIEALTSSQADLKQIHLTTLPLPQDWVRISITDTGPGIAPEQQSKIFEPFFTTKAVGQGLGMSLALCEQAIQQHKGRLTCQSTSGRGATFCIELPVHVEEARA